MSPYCPSAKKLGDVITDLIAKHGCTKRQGPPLHGPRGKVVPEYLRRVDANGVVHIAQLPQYEPTTSALPTVIRSICAQLDLDLHNTDFGVLSSLGDPDDDDDEDDAVMS